MVSLWSCVRTALCKWYVNTIVLTRKVRLKTGKWLAKGHSATTGTQVCLTQSPSEDVIYTIVSCLLGHELLTERSSVIFFFFLPHSLAGPECSVTVCWMNNDTEWHYQHTWLVSLLVFLLLILTSSRSKGSWHSWLRRTVKRLKGTIELLILPTCLLAP